MAILFMGDEAQRELFNKTLDLADGGQLVEVVLVVTEPYGSEGMMPVKGYCREYPKGDISCVGSSGDNMCGGFLGAEGDIVICGCVGDKK